VSPCLIAGWRAKLLAEHFPPIVARSPSRVAIEVRGSSMSVATAGMTENEQKQQLSVAYVHAVAARAGYACQVINIDDDSVDVQLAARGVVHHKSVLRSPKIDIQLKATAHASLKHDHLAFPLPAKNYNDLREEVLVPRLLVVLLLPADDRLWLEQTEDQMITRSCAYWRTLFGEPATKNQNSVTVHLPRDQRFTVATIRTVMEKVSRKEPV
jgi:Domain of unknown function (DUF4365)